MMQSLIKILKEDKINNEENAYTIMFHLALKLGLDVINYTNTNQIIDILTRYDCTTAENINENRTQNFIDLLTIIAKQKRSLS